MPAPTHIFQSSVFFIRQQNRTNQDEEDHTESDDRIQDRFVVRADILRQNENTQRNDESQGSNGWFTILKFVRNKIARCRHACQNVQ